MPLYSSLFVLFCFFVCKALPICSVSIYRLSASIAANLFKKKQFLIKTVNIACVDFRFVENTQCCVFSSFRFGLNSSVWGFTFCCTRYLENQSGKRAVFLTNQRRDKHRTYVHFPALIVISMFPAHFTTDTFLT